MDEIESARISRRRMLQAAAAGGVGVAAWTAPNVKTLGFKPAYAQICSTASDVTTYTSTGGFVTCGFVSSPPVVVKLNDEVWFGPGDAHSVKVSGDELAHGGNHFEIDADGVRCRITMIELWEPNGAFHDSWTVSAGSPQPVPEIGQGGGSRCGTSPDFLTWTVTIECVPEGGCFPDEVPTP